MELLENDELLKTDELLQDGGPADDPAPGPDPLQQLAGAVLIMVPAIGGASPLTGTTGTGLRVLAVVAGFVGTVLVFGGLLRGLLRRHAHDLRRHAHDRRADDEWADDVLTSIPYARRVWWGVAGLAGVLAVGALLALAGAAEGDRLVSMLLLGLPAGALGWLARRTAVMRTA